ncbi:hypothetical protein DRJ48_02885 [Candidatus Woesearchaeota archaeon]|nr:hypothetical protein [Candidatus Woesearchaeota archaeon]RLE42734.1 MAG: hypothetical protein DRJ48_02885 [Candidatus Woesearchaeota archaeon]
MLNTIGGLTEIEVIEAFLNVINSPYFRQYELWSSSGKLVSDIITVESIGGYNLSEKRWYTLGEVATILTGLLDGIRTDTPGELKELILGLYCPVDIKQEIGFKGESAISLDMHLSLQASRIESTGEYQLFVITSELRGDAYSNDGDYERDKELYSKWHEQVQSRLYEVLPFL